MKRALLMLVPTVFLVLVGAFADDYFVEIVGMALLFGLFAAAVDFSWGRAGVLTLGAALYFGIGAYFVAFGLRAGWGFVASVAAGTCASLIVAALIGATALRVRASTIQFGLMTLVASLSAQQLAVSLYDLAGGSNGISGVAKPTIQVLGSVIDFSGGSRYFSLVSVVTLLGLGALWWLASGHFGRLALCVRESDERVAAFGYDPMMVKLTASMITAAVAAVAGALFVPFSGIAEPGLFAVRPNMLVLVWVALGGQSTLVGPFFAAVLLQILQFELGSQFEDIYLLLVGLVFVVSVRSSGGRGLLALAVPRLWRRRSGFTP
jgi:ABC-type branched-subunit amino acid transport system permease subunit